MQTNACTVVATAATKTDKLHQKLAVRGMAMIMERTRTMRIITILMGVFAARFQSFWSIFSHDEIIKASKNSIFQTYAQAIFPALLNLVCNVYNRLIRFVSFIDDG